MLHILINPVQIVHRPRVLLLRVQHINPKPEVRLRIVQHPHQCRQDINLLGNLVLYLRLSLLIPGLIDNNRRTEPAQVRLIIRMVGEVRMVTGQHEDRILKPRLLAHLLKKLPDGHVRIADALMDDKPLLRKLLLILLRDGIRMMTARCEHSRHKRLLHLTHLRGIVLQERLVPDGPHPVEVIITAKSFVSIIVLPTVILLETRGSGKGLKTHRSPLCPVEERRLITLPGQERRNTTYLIH